MRLDKGEEHGGTRKLGNLVLKGRDGALGASSCGMFGFEVSQDIPGEKGLSSIVGLSRKY